MPIRRCSSGKRLELIRDVMAPSAVGLLVNGSDPDIVVGTRPSSGGAAAPGSTVALLVSRGPSTLVVPNVVGLKLDEARRQLETAGFRIGRVAKVERRGPPGTVVEQSPTAGSRAARSGRVDLTVTEVN